MDININFLFETLLVLFAIFFSNGFIYSLTIFNLNKKNCSENISIITNSSEKDGLALTSLIASNSIRLTSSGSGSSASPTLSVSSSGSSTSQAVSVSSSGSSASQTLSVSSSNASQTLSVTSSQTNVEEDIFDNENLIGSDIDWGTNTENSNTSITTGEMWPANIEDYDSFTPLDSRTILDSQTIAQWREIAMDLHELPYNTPAGIIRQVKFEELNILYSQDIIHFGITQTELRLIIEHLPATSLFNPEVNHLILTIMSYYHG